MSERHPSTDEQSTERAPQRPGDVSTDEASRADPKAQKGAENERGGSDAPDIIDQQGSGRDTPQREHERERSEPKPKKAEKEPGCGCDDDDARGSSSSRSGAGKLPTHPPGRHGDAANIDDAHQAR